ncbi:MAG: DUF3524 domain-containing protein [Planctomycetaceae bacterium]
MMRILALNPYHSGSHLRFLDGWQKHSRHEWTVLTLPGRRWKWRMRHAALSMSEQIHAAVRRGGAWDRLWVTDMLNLAELRGLCPRSVAELPAVVYFHENQLTYPVRDVAERDLHFGYSNFLSAVASDQLWFNSGFHRDSFLEALFCLLDRMPDYRHASRVRNLRSRSVICSPGIDAELAADVRQAGPLRILWAARWEHDKDPDCLFRALDRVRQRGVPFRLSVLGQAFAEVPACFEHARERFQDQIDAWGYVGDLTEYHEILRQSDLIVSTAIHEFFGIAVAEAAAAGCIPVLPDRLSYPELYGEEPTFFYQGSSTDLAERICELANQIHSPRWSELRSTAIRMASRFQWCRIAPIMDDQLQQVERCHLFGAREGGDGQTSEDATD